MTPLRELCLKKDYDDRVTPDMWSKEVNDAWEFIKNAIISDPVLVRFDYRKRIYTRTDYCNAGMGTVALQPASDPISMAAMIREQ